MILVFDLTTFTLYTNFLGINTNAIPKIAKSKLMKKPYLKTSFFLYILILFLGSCNPDSSIEDTDRIIDEEKFEQYGVPFAEVPEISDINMYEVNPLVFSPQRNLEGVRRRLDEIQDLGINVIWLMPIHPIGQEKAFGSPYAVRDFYAVNSSYGSLEDLRRLVAEAHERGMAVILDLVANHTAWDNKWITENPSWYQQDGAGNIMIAENWSDVAALNYDNPALRSEMIDVMKYWVLEANVDGYRCDFAGGVPVDFWEEAIKALRELPNREIIMFAESAEKHLFRADFNLIFGWDFQARLKEVFEDRRLASQLFTANAADYLSVPKGAHILRFTTNHDDTAWDDIPQNVFNSMEGSLAAFLITAYFGGVPMVYNGQEIGNNDRIPFFFGTNYRIDWSINPHILEEYKHILNFRKESVAIRKGSIENLASTADVLAFKKIYQDEEILILVNTKQTNSKYQIPNALQGTRWKDGFKDTEVVLAEELELPAYKYLVLEKI